MTKTEHQTEYHEQTLSRSSVLIKIETIQVFYLVNRTYDAAWRKVHYRQQDQMQEAYPEELILDLDVNKFFYPNQNSFVVVTTFICRPSPFNKAIANLIR